MRLPALAVLAVLLACKASSPESETKPTQAPADSGAVVARAWAEGRGAQADFRVTRTGDWAKGPRYHVEDARATLLVYLEGGRVASAYDITDDQRVPICSTAAECNP